MRWSIIRLIWLRELRDQLRDRRTIIMIAVLPLLLYPVLGMGVLQFAALTPARKATLVGVYGAEHLPQRTESLAVQETLPAVAWFSAAPVGPIAPGIGSGGIVGAAALAQTGALGLGQRDYPPLLRGEGDATRFLAEHFEQREEAELLVPKRLPGPVATDAQGPEAWAKSIDRAPLDNREVTLLLAVPPDFQARLQRGERPFVLVLSREGDERGRLADTRLTAVLEKWKKRIKEIRLLNHGLPVNFDEVVEIQDAERAKPTLEQVEKALGSLLARIFPFMLVMWSLTGALYPAVDLCAGEKERGTMETLLISPASREEIVYGKFLTIWVFSGTTALLNLVSMGLTTAVFSGALPNGLLRPVALLWCVVLCLPLSAFFSAVCLSVGAYARSSKEGQYYLMPLFLLTMPLIFLTLAPGVDLNPFYSMVPVTGVALLLQRLLIAKNLGEVPWGYFLPVLAPIVLYGWLALRWAVMQFQREEVLFREAERLDLGLWLKRLFREKEPLPSAGQALFCFGLIVGLRWLSLGLGSGWPIMLHTAIDLVAFVLTPPLFMAVMLTTRPVRSLGLRRAPTRSLLTATVVAGLLVLPLAGLTRLVLEQFPEFEKTLSENNPLTEPLLALQRGDTNAPAWWQVPLVLVLLAPLCEELSFRGFILNGLRQRFHPTAAIVLSSLLFALSHLNVFQFVPDFVLGMVLGLLATRSGSVLPCMLFHLVYKALLIGPLVLQHFTGTEAIVPTPVRVLLTVLCALLAAVYLGVNGYRLWVYGPFWDGSCPPTPAVAKAEPALSAKESHP
jgi:sodium transport system permease protein